VATWEDVWEDLPSQVRVQLEDEAGVASKPQAAASLLPDPVLRPEEAMVLEVLRADAALQIDEILDLLETQLTSSEVFTALFELELTGRVRQLPGKNYVRTFVTLIPPAQGRISGGPKNFSFPGSCLRVECWERRRGRTGLGATGNEDAFRVSFQSSRPYWGKRVHEDVNEAFPTVVTIGKSGTVTEKPPGSQNPEGDSGWFPRSQHWDPTVKVRGFAGPNNGDLGHP